MNVYFVLFLVVPMATGLWVKLQKYSCLGPVSPLHTSQYKQRSIQSSVIPWTVIRSRHPISLLLRSSPLTPANLNMVLGDGNSSGTSADLNTLKVDRANAKRSVTRKINIIRQNIATDVAFDLDQELSRLKSVFADFEKACEQYENAITDDDELDKCDDYFRKVQDNFIGTVAEIKTVKQGPDSKSDGASSATPVSQTCDIEKLISAINLPNWNR